MRRSSLTLRLTLIFGVMFAVLLLALGAFIARAVEQHFEEGDVHELHGKLELVRRVFAEVRSEADLAHVPQRLDAALVGHHSLSIAVVQHDGEVVFVSSGAGFPAGLIDREPAYGPRGYPPGLVWEDGARIYRAIVAAAESGMAGAAPARVVVSMDIAHHRDFMRGFTRSLWAAIAVAITLTGLLGWLAARGGLAPLRRMAEVARRISAQRLDDRIDTRNLPVELEALADEFNGMMARLEDAFRRLSDFSADIAHELRTPISNLMMETQVALTRARSAEAYREVLHSNLEEFERLARMISDMLFLAKADRGLLPRPAEAVALENEAAALAEFYEALAEDRGVRLAVTGAATVTGDRLMLRRALSNLVSNALRHTPARGRVDVTIGAVGDGVEVAVRNTGEPIPPDEMPRLFERFHRADRARARHGDGDGAGLGLAITRSIVEAHGGRIEVACADGVTTFRIRLPQVKGSADAPVDNGPAVAAGAVQSRGAGIATRTE